MWGQIQLKYYAQVDILDKCDNLNVSNYQKS